MSRGLGKLQREILGALDPAQACVNEAFGTYEFMSHVHDGGWVKCRGCKVLLAPGIYDLRAVHRWLRKQTVVRNKASFDVAVSRAVRGLVTRGILERLALVPLRSRHRDGQPQIEHLSDGFYMHAPARELRFVRKR